MLRSALRFGGGAAIGVLLWIYATPVYNGVLAALAAPTLRIDSRLRNAELLPAGRRIMARGGSAEPTLPPVLIPADQLTYNAILLLGLFATNSAAFRARGFGRLLIALGVLFATHVLALVVSLELTYATQTGAWGASRYSALGQDFWTAVEYGYRLFGMFGIAFACWWMTLVRPS